MYDPLCSLDEVKEWLGIPSNEQSKDVLLTALIERCSESIGEYCGRDNLGAVSSYSETYFEEIAPSFRKPDAALRVVLRHYPVAALTSVQWAGQVLKILQASDLQNIQSNSGVFLENDNRTLRFLGVWMPPSYGALLVNYTAGYYFDTAVAGALPIPAGLRQVCMQYVGEVYKSQSWIGYRSKSIAGEVVSFEGGNKFGMSARTVAMLQPYRNRAFI